MKISKGWLAIAKLKPLSLYISLLLMPKKAFDKVRIEKRKVKWFQLSNSYPAILGKKNTSNCESCIWVSIKSKLSEVDSIAVSIFVDVLVDLAVFVNSTNIYIGRYIYKYWDLSAVSEAGAQSVTQIGFQCKSLFRLLYFFKD